MSASTTTADLSREHTALRNGAGVHEAAAWGVLRASGKDRLAFLHKYLTQDVRGLAAGQGAEACALTVKGAMVAHLLLVARADDALLLVPLAACAPLLQHLSKYVLFDDVRFSDASGELGVTALHGPRAGEVLRAALGVEPPAGALAHVDAPQLEPGPVTVVRHDLGRLAGFALIGPRAGQAALVERLAGAGAVAVGDGAAEAVRVEEGVPLFGQDLDERTIPIEAGLGERAISTTKGCYTGQEVIARILHRGHVNRRVAGLRFPAGAPVETGPLFAGEKEVGRVTSAAASPELGGIGLALLHNKHPEGAALTLGGPAGPALTVSALPFSR